MALRPAEVASEGQRNEVRALWGRNLASGEEAASAKRFDWKYESSPFGRGIVWELRGEEGELVGAAGLGRNRFRIAGRPVPAGQAVDLAVERAHRTVGPALALQRAVTAVVGTREVSFLYGFPNVHSEPVLRRAGYRPLAPFERWSKLLRGGPRLAGRLPWGPAARAVSRVADGTLRAVAKDSYYRRPAGVATAMETGFDARFDRLWEESSAHFPVLGERTGAALAWRFGQFPFRTFRVFCLLSEGGGRLLGYVVYRASDRFARMSDFLAVSPGWLVPLFHEFSLAMRETECESISTGYLGSAAVRDALRGAGFRRRPGSLNVVLFARDEPERLFDPEAWHLTDADRDV